MHTQAPRVKRTMSKNYSNDDDEDNDDQKNILKCNGTVTCFSSTSFHSVSIDRENKTATTTITDTIC